jgi:hypothetical protein
MSKNTMLKLAAKQNNEIAPGERKHGNGRAQAQRA